MPIFPVDENYDLPKQLENFRAIAGEADQEYERQLKKWGLQSHDNLYWLGIVAEELGEAAKESIEFDDAKLRVELIQLAACAISWIECLDRGHAARAGPAI